MGFDNAAPQANFLSACVTKQFSSRHREAFVRKFPYALSRRNRLRVAGAGACCEFVNIFRFLVKSYFLGAFSLSNKKTAVLLLASEVVVSRPSIISLSDDPLSSEITSSLGPLKALALAPAAVMKIMHTHTKLCLGG